MGKMIKLISAVIIVDLIFITFWGGSGSLNSMIASWLIDPTNFDNNLLTIAIQALITTIAAVALASVVVRQSGAKTDTVLFALFAL